MRRLAFWFLLSIPSLALADQDGDGVSDVDGDCDDTDNTIYPSAPELCDGLDNDCDGSTDEDIDVTYWADADGDGYGDAGVTVEDCDQPTGYVLNSVDCDDTDPTVSPAAEEICDNGIDDNCNGTENEGCDEDTGGSGAEPSAEPAGEPGGEPSGEPNGEPSGEPSNEQEFEPNDGEQDAPNVGDQDLGNPDEESGNGSGVGPAAGGGPDSLKSTESGCGSSSATLLLIPLFGLARNRRQ